MPVHLSVIGVGHLGEIHARILAELPDAELTSIVDVDQQRAREIGNEHGVPFYTSLSSLLEEAPPDAAVISVPTEDHFSTATTCLDHGVPVLVEKPMTRSIERAEALVKHAEERETVIQVGHVERFNPAVAHLKERMKNPRFIDCERLSPFRFRSADIDVVQDVMIHDLDILLSLVPGSAEAVDSVGTSVITPFPDIVNTRIHFSEGCVANLSASRISTDSVRKLRVFTPEAYYSLDYSEKELQVLRGSERLQNISLADIQQIRQKEERGELDTEATFEEFLETEQVVSEEEKREEPLKRELMEFISSVRSGEPPETSGEDGVKALKLAREIRDGLV